ncbi:helix-turn-helix transcriptional regulator [Methylocystis heyeri]|uniref:LuxR family transcriptional regulator n=1 Tax=Methylocystis heyeri TaxID=391905 RepID=A0A6B8KDV4_9HYPH|nr:helix-turn-helix transcriptional regulator [Methylocystis heyeri]QGM44613.1 LuxR family transcriptional regulator [Methylocystis heyeri]
MADFENLVDRIYEAAADADLWPQVMHDLGGAVDGAGGIILTRRSDAWLGWRYSAALAPGAEEFMRDGATRTQATARMLALNRAGFADAQEVFTEEEYLADPLIAEWGALAGLHHAAATAIPVPSGDFVVVQVNRRIGQQCFSRGDLARLDAFRPHLARAGLLAARWRLQKLRAAAEALAMIGLPAAVLDATGKVLAANALIEGLRSHLMWLPKDRIALVDPAANELLRRAIAEVDDPTASSVRSFPVKGAAGDPVVVHLIPATGTARDLFEGGFSVLAVTPLAAPSAPDAALIQGLFDLTAAEARVAGGVAEGLTLDEIAARHGVTVGTIRSQIKSVFAKTGAARQSQLAALLAAQTKIPLK